MEQRRTVNTLEEANDEIDRLLALVNAQSSPSPAPPGGGPESRIRYNDAKNSYMGYYNSSKSLEVEEGVSLRGFNLKVSNLREIEEADSLFLMFGLRPDGGYDPSGNLTFSSYFTLLVLGLDSANNIISDKHSDPIVYEYLSPCPTTCPVDISTLFPTS